MRLKIIFIGLLMIASHCMAHDLWLEKEQNALKLLYGHKQSTHGGDTYLTYDPKQVKEVKGLINGNIENVNFDKNYPVTVKPIYDATFACYSSGFWTKTVYGTLNISKENQKNVVKSWYSEESVKFIHRWSENAAKPLTENLELNSLVDPAKLKPGDKIRLLVTYKGKPVKDVPVAYGDEPRGTTDDQGKINIRIQRAGFQIISASLTRPGDGIKADEVITTTSLNFMVEK
ncbi:MAG: DUF4198 domain-containing protein [Candidatus Omnitrophota bacterium]